jgi:hypothetical protein
LRHVGFCCLVRNPTGPRGVMAPGDSFPRPLVCDSVFCSLRRLRSEPPRFSVSCVCSRLGPGLSAGMSTSPLPSPGGPVGKCVVFGCTQIGQPKFCAQHSTALRRPSINVQTGFNRATSGIFNLSPSLPPDASPAPMLVRRSTTTLLVPGGKLPTDYWNRSPQRSPQRSPTRSLPREIDESAEYQLPPSPDFRFVCFCTPFFFVSS